MNRSVAGLNVALKRRNTTGQYMFLKTIVDILSHWEMQVELHQEFSSP